MAAATEFLQEFYGRNNRSIAVQYLSSIEDSESSVHDERSAVFRVHRLLSELETCTNDIFLSIDKLAAIQDLLAPSRSLISRGTVSHRILMDEFRQAQSRVKAELRGMIEMTVQFTRPHQLTVQQRTTHKGHFVQLKDLLSHLQSMDLLADYLERFVSNILIPEFIQPILSGSFTIQLHSTVYSSTCKLVAAPQPQATEKMLQSIRELSEFTQKNFESMLLIVPWFHRRIIEMVMPVVLASAEPISGRLSTEQLSQLSTNILEFERYMINNGWQIEGQMEWTEIMETLHARLQAKRRQELISSVRDLMVNNKDLQTVQVSDFSERGGVKVKGVITGPGGKGGKGGKGAQGGGYIDSDLTLPNMLISSTTQCLVEMAYQHIDSALQTTDENSKIEAFYSARDIVDSWRSIMPAVHGRRIIHEPSAAALFFNDCQYWDYHLRTMMYPAFSSGTFPEPLRETCSMVDLIPLIRRLGDYHIRLQLVRQRDEVKQLIVEMNQFKDANDPEECQLTEERLERLAYKLSSLAQSWKSILSQEHFLEFFGLLLNSAIEELSEYFKALNDRLASQMMEIDRVAEETFLVKYWINRHFNSQVEQWMQVFVEENGQRTHQMQSSPIAKYVVRWQEFLTLTSN